MTKGSLREEMPITTAWIDDLRKTFGRAYIDAIVRQGLRGEPVFFASENGHVIGTAAPVGIRAGKDARGNRCLLDGPVAGEVASTRPPGDRERNRDRQTARMKELQLAHQTGSADVCIKNWDKE